MFEGPSIRNFTLSLKRHRNHASPKAPCSRQTRGSARARGQGTTTFPGGNQKNMNSPNLCRSGIFGRGGKGERERDEKMCQRQVPGTNGRINEIAVTAFLPLSSRAWPRTMPPDTSSIHVYIKKDITRPTGCSDPVTEAIAGIR